MNDSDIKRNPRAFLSDCELNPSCCAIVATPLAVKVLTVEINKLELRIRTLLEAKTCLQSRV